MRAFGSPCALEGRAEACGGCFVPPEDATVVTDHRMILSVGNNESTLYDQIRYQGLPTEFAWVLPISGDATVGLSADTLFSTIGGFTQTTVIAPPQNCPPRSERLSTAGFGADGERLREVGFSADAGRRARAASR